MLNKEHLEHLRAVKSGVTRDGHDEIAAPLWHRPACTGMHLAPVRTCALSDRRSSVSRRLSGEGAYKERPAEARESPGPSLQRCSA